MDTKGLSGAEALLRLLARMGVERIFASPGSEWSPVWEHLAKPVGAAGEIPRYLSSRHEEIAVAMAAGYAKASGKLPAVMLHTTVGSLHATMALRGALHERVPMVVLAGESIGFGEEPGPDPGHQWLRLLADLGGPARLVERCVKWSAGVNARALLPATIQRACQLAMAAPPGPVFVSVPMEFLFETLATDPPPAAGFARAATARPDAIDELARVLTGAASPLIVTEEAGRSVRAVEHLVALAELLGAPVVEAWHPGYVNFPRTHPLYGGVGPLAHLAGYLKEADVVFLVAAVAPWHPPSAAPGPGTTVVVLDEDPFRADLPFWGYRADLAVTGEVEGSLALLVERVRQTLAPGTRADRVERWRARHDAARSALREQARASGTRKTIETRWVVHELNEVLPPDAVVVDETITHRLDVHRFLPRLTPGRFVEASCGGLGTGLGTALGVKAAAPDRTVIALIGDGSFNYNPVLAALGCAQEHRLPILIVLFDNAGYLSQKSGVPRHYPDGWAVRSRTFVGTSITPSPDYAAIARAFDGYGEKVEAPAEVRAALRRGLSAVAAGRVALLDMTLEPLNASGEV
ncbi:MAG: thiamine pyrophosphate-binding protein [Candidatus Rokubacteria bacterium]|nr:thiamine pyrophosphate-binding protein [Candidatus Rokubacteria bacterium]